MRDDHLKARNQYDDSGPIAVFSSDDISKIPEELVGYYKQLFDHIKDPDKRDKALEVLAGRDRDLVDQLVNDWVWGGK